MEKKVPFSSLTKPPPKMGSSQGVGGMLAQKIIENYTANTAIAQHSGNNLLSFACSNLIDVQGIKNLVYTTYKA